jgi:WD40 repeat protein
MLNKLFFLGLLCSLTNSILATEIVTEAGYSFSPTALLTGHRGSVDEVQYSPNGRLIASRSFNDSTIRIWDVETTKELGVLSFSSPPEQMQFSADGDFLSSVERSGIVTLWDAITWTANSRFSSRDVPASQAVFTPDGQAILVVHQDGMLQLWDVHSGKKLHHFQAPNDSIYSLQFSPDERFLLIATQRPLKNPGGRWINTQVLQVWDLYTGEMIRTVSNIYALAYSPDGNRLVAGTYNRLQIWNVQTGELLRPLTGHQGEITSLAYSSDGRFIASGATDAQVRIWDAETGEIVHILLGHDAAINSLAYAPDGSRREAASAERFLVSSSATGMKKWNLLTGQEVFTFQPYVLLGPHFETADIVYSSDGNIVLAVNLHLSHFPIWDAHTGKNLGRLNLEMGMGTGNAQNMALGYTLKAQRLVAAYGDKLLLWDMSTGALLKVFQGHEDIVTDVDINYDGNLLVSVGRDGSLKLWDAETGKILHNWIRDGLTSVAFSPDGNTVTAGGFDNHIQSWDVATGILQQSFIGQIGQNNVLSLENYPPINSKYSPDKRLFMLQQSNDLHIVDSATKENIHILPNTHLFNAKWSPDGRFIIAGYGTLNLWDTATGEKLRTFTNPIGNIVDFSWSPFEHSIITANENHILQLWDVSTGQALRSFGDNHVIEDFSLSADGLILLSKSEKDCNLKLWDTNSQTEILSIQPHELAYSCLNQAILSPDGRLIATGAGESVKLFDASTGIELQDFHYPTSSNITALKFSTHSRFLIAYANEFIDVGTRPIPVRIWDIQNNTEIESLSGRFYQAAISPDEQFLITDSGNYGNYDLHLWDMNTGTEIRNFTGGHTNILQDLAFSADGNLILSTQCCINSNSKRIKLWDSNTGLEVHDFSGQIDNLSTAFFSPSGRFIVSNAFASSAVKKPAVQLWQAKTGKKLGTFYGAAVQNSFSINEKSLIVWSDNHQADGLVQWDIASGQVIRHIKGKIPKFIRTNDNRLYSNNANNHYHDTRQINVWDSSYSATDIPPKTLSIRPSTNQTIYKYGDDLSFYLYMLNGDINTRYDVYAAIIFPDGNFYTLSDFAIWSAKNQLVPIQTDVDLSQPMAFGVLSTILYQNVPTEIYQACAVLTDSSSNPWDFENWRTYQCYSFMGK